MVVDQFAESETPGIHLCTSVVQAFSLEQVVEIAVEAGFDGIELRVAGDGHQSLDELERYGPELRHRLERGGLRIAVLNSYAGIHDEERVARLIRCAERMGRPMVRVVLPRAGAGEVAQLSCEPQVIPSYVCTLSPVDAVHFVQARLRQLERQALERNVRLLLELHWATIMSSFSAAALLLRDIDSEAIALTFDPANMIVEGREDWQFGIGLNRSRIENVHVKNATWTNLPAPAWSWANVNDGMVDWPRMIALLNDSGYSGDYAVEDFLTPCASASQAMDHLGRVRAWLAGSLRSLAAHDLASAARPAFIT